ncbi:MAG TPA: hypothetical protein VGM56_12180 [Byssovorax sp.]|jgi:hypothetical protein|nr:hypothetical protein [Polyangia bacterium]
MAKKIPASDPVPVDPVASANVLEETPPRALKFLSAVSRTPAIFAALAQRGYDEETHAEGWELLWTASGATRPGAPAAPRTDPTVQKALATVDAWDEPNFRVIRATLENAFTAQCDFLFAGGLAAATGEASLGTVKTMLDRLDALQHGTGRAKEDHKQDQAALKKLEKRSITPDVRAELAGLIATATAAPKGGATPAVASTTSADTRTRALNDLRVWYKEWATIAPTVIKRRDYLIALGIAKREKPKKPGPTPPPATT